MAASQKNKSIFIHLFYWLIIASLSIYQWQMNQKEQALWQLVGHYAEMGNRCLEYGLNTVYTELKTIQMDYRSKTIDDNMDRLDALLHHVDALANDQVSIANFSQALYKLTPGDSDLHNALGPLTWSIIAGSDKPQYFEHQLLVLKKNALKAFICNNFAQKMTVCGGLRQDHLVINLTNGLVCSSIGDTLLLRFDMAPTAVAAEKMFSKIRFSIDAQTINSSGFMGVYPLVFHKKGKQEVKVKAETTDVLTGETRTYWRKFEWCVF